ncbi:hypothetical protein [Peptostreptococcus stomatis]|uniref:hypothetical protein n=1 Tax=Peptostreptococcus stomatis TaxID=341694 RepID=UPI0002F4E0A8|nr:hypothetical protein [Peptostreptococcus stomatis]
MTFINNIFKLYYHELKVNKKILLLLGVAVLTWFLFSLFNSYRGQYSAGDIDLIRDLSPKILESASNGQEKAFLKEVLTGAIGFKSAMTGNILMLAPICLASILASYILVTRDFRKKNSSFYLVYNLPNRIIEIKLAKILAGLSLYIYTILLITLGLVLMDNINLLKFGNLYRPGIWNMTKEILFLPFDFRSSIFYTFMLVFPSIIGLQSCASIIYAGSIKIRFAKRIGFFVLIFFASVLVLFIGIDVNTYGIFRGLGQGYLTSIPTFIFILVLYILVAVLFVMDMVYSRDSFRGGLGYEDK